MYPAVDEWRLGSFFGIFQQNKKQVSITEVKEYLPNSEIKQGRIGDCYLLAAINSLKKEHPELYLSVLSKSLRKGENPGEWQGKF